MNTRGLSMAVPLMVLLIATSMTVPALADAGESGVHLTYGYHKKHDGLDHRFRHGGYRLREKPRASHHYRHRHHRQGYEKHYYPRRHRDYGKHHYRHRHHRYSKDRHHLRHRFGHHRSHRHDGYRRGPRTTFSFSYHD